MEEGSLKGEHLTGWGVKPQPVLDKKGNSSGY